MTDRSPSSGRPALAVRTACLLLALAGLPLPLAAQTSDPILVSNQTKARANNPYISQGRLYAQQFRTGSASAGYNISDVILTFSKGADRGTTTVTIRSDNGGNPAGSALATITLDSAPDGATSFTPASPVRVMPENQVLDRGAAFNGRYLASAVGHDLDRQRP